MGRPRSIIEKLLMVTRGAGASFQRSAGAVKKAVVKALSHIGSCGVFILVFQRRHPPLIIIGLTEQLQVHLMGLRRRGGEASVCNCTGPASESCGCLSEPPGRPGAA